MYTLQINAVCPLHMDCSQKYEGIAFDGTRFSCPQSGCRAMSVFDEAFCPLTSVSTRRAYTAICYDPYFKCYWALSRQPNRIYQLDHCYQEIGHIQVKTCSALPMVLSDVACRDADTLMICCLDGIASLCKCGDDVPVILKKMPANVLCTGIAAVENHFLYAFTTHQAQAISAYSREWEFLSQCGLPAEFQVMGLCRVPYEEAGYILVQQRGCASVLGFELSCIETLSSQCDTCGASDECGRCLLVEVCSEADRVLESIAFIETALSKILNVEGEKIKNVLSSCDSPDEMIAVNASVVQVMTQMTHLEHVLYNNLELAKELMNNCATCDEVDAGDDAHRSSQNENN